MEAIIWTIHLLACVVVFISLLAVLLVCIKDDTVYPIKAIEEEPEPINDELSDDENQIFINP